VQFTAQWEGAQLGQVTKLTLGQDKGWRGAIEVSASLTGTPEDLTVATDASIQNFRRYDIAGDKVFRLAARCSGHYSSSNHVVSRLACRAPVSTGSIAVSGSVALLSPSRAYDLAILAQDLPVQPLVDFARRVKKNVPADVVATGKLDAEVKLRHAFTGIGPVWQGGGAIIGLNVRSAVNNTRVAMERIPFVVSSGGDRELKSGIERGRSIPTELPVEAHIDVGPFSLGLGRPANATVHGQFSGHGYNLVVQGDSEVQRLLDVARTAGLPTPPLAANGEARINLHVGGTWAGFTAPLVTGTALLNSIHARLRGLNDPVELTSASLSLRPEVTEIEKLTVVAAGNAWRGSLSIPRQCNTPHTCPIRFDLRADEVVAGALGTAGASSGKQPWYRFLSSTGQSPPAQSASGQSALGQSAAGQSRPYLASVHAVGRLSAGRVLIHNLVASRVSADVELEQGRLQLTNLRGEIMGGRHTGEWTADFTASPPTYSGVGTLEKIALGQLAEAMDDGWITGTASVAYRANTLGWSKPELLSGAIASLQVEARDGSLPHLALAGEVAPLRVNRFVGRLHLRDGKFEVEEGKLQTPVGIYQLSGTASLGRVLDIKLAREGARGFNITGTLTQPHVVMNASPETQAALKP
jgi:hypothetical protein